MVAVVENFFCGVKARAKARIKKKLLGGKMVVVFIM